MTKVDTTARLVEIEGDQEDFADLLGEEGRLYLSDETSWFNARGSDTLTMARKKVTVKDGMIQVATTFGNTFTFKDLKS